MILRKIQLKYAVGLRLASFFNLKYMFLGTTQLKNKRIKFKGGHQCEKNNQITMFVSLLKLFRFLIQIIKASLAELGIPRRYQLQPYTHFFLMKNKVHHNGNFTRNLSLNMKPSFASRSSTDCFALFSTQVTELYKES